jgi:nitrous oxide reductase
VNENTTSKRFERRKFLGAVAAMAGATAAVGAARAATVTEEATPSAAPENPQEGYRETAHIRRYYETARL